MVYLTSSEYLSKNQEPGVTIRPVCFVQYKCEIKAKVSGGLSI